MATKKKTTAKKTTNEEEEILTAPEEVATPVEEESVVTEQVIAPKENKKEEKKIEPKLKVGDIAFISKDADADLNGFKLFPQYKKYAYTVEAYDAKSDVYTLRRLNLSLKLKGELILAPGERAHDTINRMQF
jgi:hypothetical protein